MLSPELLKSKFDAGLPYEQYINSGSTDNLNAWNSFGAEVSLTDTQRAMLAGFERTVNAIVISGIWCGDCSQQIPMLKHIEDATGGRLIIRYLDRDQHMDLAQQVMICGGNRVPVVLLLNEDFDFVGLAGDRVLARYRAMAARKLGAACALPGAPVPPDEIAATLQDWVNEFERAHLICRLSTKLRERHDD